MWLRRVEERLLALRFEKVLRAVVNELLLLQTLLSLRMLQML